MPLWHILYRLTLPICTNINSSMAERVGFEPTVPLVSGTLDFESSAFDQLSHLSRSAVIKDYSIISSSNSQASLIYLSHFTLNNFFSFAIRLPSSVLRSTPISSKHFMVSFLCLNFSTNSLVFL